MIRIRRNELRPGDVIQEIYESGEWFDVERSAPDPSKIYSTFSPSLNESIIFKENGTGYWHGYKSLSLIGKHWDDFKNTHNITQYKIIGENLEEL